MKNVNMIVEIDVCADDNKSASEWAKWVENEVLEKIENAVSGLLESPLSVYVHLESVDI